MSAVWRQCGLCNRLHTLAGDSCASILTIFIRCRRASVALLAFERLGWGILTISARIMSFARSIGWSGPSWASLARHGPKVVPDMGTLGRQEAAEDTHFSGIMLELMGLVAWLSSWRVRVREEWCSGCEGRQAHITSE